MDKDKVAHCVHKLLEALGEDPGREGLRETPQRIARLYEDMLSGTREDPSKWLEQTFKDENHQELVLIKNITFYSFCEHHLLPFWGKVHIGYIPKNGELVGLSKLARVVHSFSKRLQIQERLTSQIADCINHTLQPLGVSVVIEAEHMCMNMRGIKSPGATTITSAVRGAFHKNQKTRSELLSLLKSSSP